MSEKSSNSCWYLTVPADIGKNGSADLKKLDQKWWKTVTVTNRAQNSDKMKEVHLLMAEILHQLIL